MEKRESFSYFSLLAMVKKQTVLDIGVFIYVFVAIPFLVYVTDTPMLVGFNPEKYVPWSQLPWDNLTCAFMVLGVILTLGFLIARAYCQHLGYSKLKWARIVGISMIVVFVAWAAMFVPCMMLAMTDTSAANACSSRMSVRAMTVLMSVFMYAGTLTLVINKLDKDRQETQHVANPVANKDSPTSTPAKVHDTDTLRKRSVPAVSE